MASDDMGQSETSHLADDHLNMTSDHCIKAVGETVTLGQQFGATSSYCNAEQGNCLTSVSITSSGDTCPSNACEQRNILRGLLSQRPPADEVSYEPPEPLERRFASIMPFLPLRTTDLAAFAHRPRCQSVDANLLSLKQPARTLSRDSLDSMCDNIEHSVEYGCITPRLGCTENQIEATRTRLMSLTTDSCESELGLTCSTGRNSSSQPGSPPRTELLMPERMYQHRKYSEGSQLKARLQALRMGFRTPADPVQQLGVSTYGNSTKPVDLTCRRRRKFEGMVGLPYGRRVSVINPVASNCSIDEGIDDDSCSDSSSILKSILTGRERSNTISVCGLRSGPDPVSDLDSRRFYRQPVALAKKTLHPVSAKISDCLSRIVTFTRSLSDFAELPSTEQRTLMAAALPRLLLLFMAESNVHFVVAPVLQHNKMDEFVEENKDDDSASSSSSASGGSRVQPGAAGRNVEQNSSEMPTLQFAECVKNFVSKCQCLAISPEEYHYMRVIALFQSVG
jgi:hypothetical protein